MHRLSYYTGRISGCQVFFREIRGKARRFVHKLAIFCFQIRHGPFKTPDYSMIRRSAEAVSRRPSLRRSSFLPLFFLIPFCKEPPVPASTGGFLLFTREQRREKREEPKCPAGRDAGMARHGRGMPPPLQIKTGVPTAPHPSWAKAHDTFSHKIHSIFGKNRILSRFRRYS